MADCTHWDGCVAQHPACLDALVARLRGLLAQATPRAEAAERLRAFDTSAVPLPKGLMLEYVRLDEMWQQLVRERDTLQADLARVTAERDEAQRAVRIVTDDWNAIEQAREQAEAQRDAAVAALEEIDGLVTTDSADIARVVGAALDALAAAKED